MRLATPIVTCGLWFALFVPGAADEQPPAGGASVAANAPASAADEFNQRVRPVLEARCFRCHGPQTQKADLNLSTAAGILRGGESGEILNRQEPTQGTLYEFVHERLMPPEGEGELTADEADTILRWIKSGAELGATPAEPAAQVSQHDALPILLLRCAVCHGRQRQEGGLDVRSVPALLAGGKSGAVIVPGKPQESRLLQRIQAGEMPPRKVLAHYSVKPVTEEEITTLERWIAAGVPVVDVTPDVATTEPDPLVSDAERQFWSFQAPRPQALPAVREIARVRNPIDAFVFARLEATGLSLAAEADRVTLIRRAYFDLIGLPPEPAEVDAFVADQRPDAYERLIERLLASRHYGERWGQYWLDLAGYSDSEGIQHADDVRQHVWRYRDYVIRAFNADKPYNEFLTEQLAGDELADLEHAAEITPHMADSLVATAFLRMAPDATYSPITAFVPDRLEVIDDEIEVFSSAVLGLTIKCARCHSHKFDPIPQRDYYRLAATLKGALDEHDWLAPRLGGPDQPKDALTCLLPYVSTAERAAWTAAGAKPADEPRIRAVFDHGEPSDTYVLRRGNYLARGPLVGPGVPSVLTDGRTPFRVDPPWPGAKKTGRRLALARWVTQADHPLTARVLVNRVWKHHFGEGIVRTLDNFGKTGAPPTHPELLDWLALEFVEHGWSIKSLHRLLMTAAVYRQSSAISPEHERLDPENALVSRMPLKRMEGEVLRDSLLAVSGRLNMTPFGPPDPLDVRADGLVSDRAGADHRFRRSIYVLKRRTQPLTILQGFDVAGMDPNCVARSESIVAPQALHLSNNALVRELAASMAERVWNETGDDPPAQIRAMYRLAAGREPTAEELQAALAAHGKLTSAWSGRAGGTRHELIATTHLWVRESAPQTVYEDDLISVWSKAATDGARRVGIIEFDVAALAQLRWSQVYLELGYLGGPAVSQSAVLIPPGIGGLNWQRFVQEKQPAAQSLAELGRVRLPAGAGGASVGDFIRSLPATSDDLRLVQAAAQANGKLAFALVADEDGAAYQQDWDDGVHASTRGRPPRLIVYDDRDEATAARHKALENLCHAIFNSAAFLYID
ncbi:MAG: PSD1 and planctomycete cytochrome C domain-containing protein [Pirellulales bacterium]